MGKIRRKFEPEFKRQMVEQVETGQVTMAQAAREYQILRIPLIVITSSGIMISDSGHRDHPP